MNIQHLPLKQQKKTYPAYSEAETTTTKYEYYYDTTAHQPQIEKPSTKHPETTTTYAPPQIQQPYPYTSTFSNSKHCNLDKACDPDSLCHSIWDVSYKENIWSAHAKDKNEETLQIKLNSISEYSCDALAHENTFSTLAPWRRLTLDKNHCTKSCRYVNELGNTTWLKDDNFYLTPAQTNFCGNKQQISSKICLKDCDGGYSDYQKHTTTSAPWRRMKTASRRKLGSSSSSSDDGDYDEEYDEDYGGAYNVEGNYREHGSEHHSYKYYYSRNYTYYYDNNNHEHEHHRKDNNYNHDSSDSDSYNEHKPYYYYDTKPPKYEYEYEYDSSSSDSNSYESIDSSSGGYNPNYYYYYYYYYPETTSYVDKCHYSYYNFSLITFKDYPNVMSFKVDIQNWPFFKNTNEIEVCLDINTVNLYETYPYGVKDVTEICENCESGSSNFVETLNFGEWRIDVPNLYWCNDQVKNTEVYFNILNKREFDVCFIFPYCDGSIYYEGLLLKEETENEEINIKKIGLNYNDQEGFFIDDDIQAEVTVKTKHGYFVYVLIGAVSIVIIVAMILFYPRKKKYAEVKNQEVNQEKNPHGTVNEEEDLEIEE